MGRRALRKYATEVDLSRHLFTLDEQDQLGTPADLFNRPAPLEIEIGSGKGLFIANAARAFPEHNFLGVELASKYARFAAQRLARLGLENAVMLRGDATLLLQERIAPSSLAAIHVYFPDPWWKARHKKRRIMNRPLIRRMEQLLQPGGRLHFWTDVEEYFQTTLALIDEETSLRGPLPVEEHSPEHDLDFRTHFERKKRLAGATIHRCEFERV